LLVQDRWLRSFGISQRAQALRAARGALFGLQCGFFSLAKTAGASRRQGQTAARSACALCEMLSMLFSASLRAISAPSARNAFNQPARRHSIRTPAEMIREHRSYAGGEFARVGDVQEFVRAVGVGGWAEDAGDHELGVGEAFAEHGHEGDGAALAHVEA